MTTSSNSVTSKELISVVMFSAGSREITLANLKQLFSMKPEHWQLDVHLVIDTANEATLKLIDSLGLQISITEANGKNSNGRQLAKIVRNLPANGDAVLWLGADTVFNSDAYIQVNNFHKQYPSAVLVGQFQDAATSQISAGGYSRLGFVFGKKTRLQAQTLPLDVSYFDDNLVLVPSSVSNKIGQPTNWPKKINKYAIYVAIGNRKRMRCLAIPGFLGTFHD